ncbi:flavodoxin [Aurantivibrio plasticivorans]
MNKIGMFFGTETGTTRLIAKKLHKLIGDENAAKPINVNRINAEDFMQYDAYILGTPSYGVGDIPGLSAGCLERNWEEFLDVLGRQDLSGKCCAFYGLGAQERYSERFASSLIALYRVFESMGATMIGDWSTDGYTFESSASVVDGRFVGLVIDQRTQSMETATRLEQWTQQVVPELLAHIQKVSQHAA